MKKFDWPDFSSFGGSFFVTLVNGQRYVVLRGVEENSEIGTYFTEQMGFRSNRAKGEVPQIFKKISDGEIIPISKIVRDLKIVPVVKTDIRQISPKMMPMIEGGEESFESAFGIRFVGLNHKKETVTDSIFGRAIHRKSENGETYFVSPEGAKGELGEFLIADPSLSSDLLKDKSLCAKGLLETLKLSGSPDLTQENFCSYVQDIYGLKSTPEFSDSNVQEFLGFVHMELRRFVVDNSPQVTESRFHKARGLFDKVPSLQKREALLEKTSPELTLPLSLAIEHALESQKEKGSVYVVSENAYSHVDFSKNSNLKVVTKSGSFAKHADEMVGKNVSVPRDGFDFGQLRDAAIVYANPEYSYTYPQGDERFASRFGHHLQSMKVLQEKSDSTIAFIAVPEPELAERVKLRVDNEESSFSDFYTRIESEFEVLGAVQVNRNLIAPHGNSFHLGLLAVGRRKVDGIDTRASNTNKNTLLKPKKSLKNWEDVWDFAEELRKEVSWFKKVEEKLQDDVAVEAEIANIPEVKEKEQKQQSVSVSEDDLFDEFFEEVPTAEIDASEKPKVQEEAPKQEEKGPLGPESDVITSPAENTKEQEVVEATLEPTKQPEVENELDKLDRRFQDRYADVCATALGEAKSMFPTNLRAPMIMAVENFKKKHGDMDSYLMENTGRTLNDLKITFLPEQRDAIGFAIDKIESGRPFVLGDEAGRGKSWPECELAAWARKKHNKRVLFVTEKANMFSSLYQCMERIGHANLFQKVLIVNGDTEARIFRKATPDEIESGVRKPAFRHSKRELDDMIRNMKTLEEGDYDIAFVTPSQFNRAKVAIANEDGTISYEANKASWLMKACEGAFVVVDEAHLLVGDSNQSRNFNDALPHAWGKMYASATVASDVVQLGRLQGVLPEEFCDKTLKKMKDTGGQEAAAAMTFNLTANGQYRRVESNKANDKFEVLIDEKNKEKNEEIFNRYARLMLKINALSSEIKSAADAISKDIKEKESKLDKTKRQIQAAIGAGVEYRGFSNYMHNLQRAVHFCLIAPFAGDEIVKSMEERGEKPLIFFDQTLEGLLKEALAEYKRSLNSESVDEHLGLDLSIVDRLEEFDKKTLEQKMISGLEFDDDEFAVKFEDEDEDPAQEGTVNPIAEEDKAEVKVDLTEGVKIKIPTINDMIRKSFEKILYAKETTPAGFVIQKSILDLVLKNSKATRMDKQAILDKVKEIEDEINSFDSMKAIPIDIMLGKIRQAGYAVDEMSGRGLQCELIPGDDEYCILKRLVVDKQASVERFQQGIIKPIAFNRANNSGWSGHQCAEAADKSRRATFAVQKPLSEKMLDQISKRGNREGQWQTPIMYGFSLDLHFERRDFDIEQNKGKMKGALLESNRDSKDVEKFENVSLLNGVGNRVVKEYLIENPELADMIGMKIDFELEDEDEINYEDKSIVSKFTGIVQKCLPNDMQGEILKDLDSRMMDRLKELEAQNFNPLETPVMDWKATVISRSVFAGTESEDGIYEDMFEQPVFKTHIEYEREIKPLKFKKIEEYTKKGIEKWNEHFGLEKYSSKASSSLRSEIEKAIQEKMDKALLRYPEFFSDPEKPTETELKNARDMSTRGGEKYKPIKDFYHDPMMWIKRNLDKLYPGALVSVPYFGIPFNALVTDVTFPKKKEDLHKLGQYKVRFAIPGEEELLDVSFASLARKGFAISSIKSLDDLGGSTKDAFEAHKTRKEKARRFVLDGNILQAIRFSSHSDQAGLMGRPIIYTDENEVKRHCVALRASFTEADLDKFPVPLAVKNVRKIAGQLGSSYLLSTSANPKDISGIRLSVVGSSIKITTLNSRKSESWAQDKELQSAAGVTFNRFGTEIEVHSPLTNLDAILAVIEDKEKSIFVHNVGVEKINEIQKGKKGKKPKADKDDIGLAA